jgi:hypothetical protein
VLLAACIYPFLARILWACRVSVVSAFGGYFLFLFVGQAQDLLADTTRGDNTFLHIGYWTFFFASLFLVWALPVHYAARDILDEPGKPWFFTRREITSENPQQRDNRFQAFCSHRDKDLIVWTPRALGSIPIVAVLIGVICA